MRGSRSPTSSSSSSSGEDGDADWRAAINSIVGIAAPSTIFSGQVISTGGGPKFDASGNDKKKSLGPALKLYQIKAQKLLDDLLGKKLEIVKNPIPDLHDASRSSEGGIRLFSKAPPGVILEPIDTYQQPRKKPRILPGEEIDEKSKKFRKQLKDVAVDGTAIITAAREACKRSLATFEAREASAEAAAKREEARVAELKKIRGEKWLPSIAKHIQIEGEIDNIGLL